MTKMNLNGQEKSEVTNAIKNAIKAAMILANTNDGDYGESKLDAEIFGDNWKVYVTNDESKYTFGLIYAPLREYEFNVCVDINSLMDYELMCGDFIDSVCEQLYYYLASNIYSEKVESIVTEVAKAAYIDCNSAYIGKGWKLGWLKHKDVIGQLFVDYTIYHNDEKFHKIRTVPLLTIEPIVEVVCKLIND